MPTVKRTGKSRMSQIEVPLVAWMEEMPSSAISEEVSKPRPNRMPRGYIFHGLKKRDQISRYSPSRFTPSPPVLISNSGHWNIRHIPINQLEHFLKKMKQTPSAL